MAETVKKKRERLASEIERLNALYQGDGLGKKRGQEGTREVDGAPVDDVFLSGGTCFSEPWLRDDEAVCPETNLTYYKHLGYNPHVTHVPFKAVVA